MTYPAASDWRSAVPGSAWYIRRVAITGLNDTVCGSTGWALLGAIQTAVESRLTGTGPLPTYRGDIAAAAIPVTGFETASGTPVGPGWDDALLRGIYALAQRDGLGNLAPEYLSAVVADGQAAARGEHQALNPKTVATALWVAFYNAGQRTSDAGEEDIYGLGSPAEIVLRADARLPLANVRPPIPPVDARNASQCGPVSQAAGTSSGLAWWLLGAGILGVTGYVMYKGMR